MRSSSGAHFIALDHIRAVAALLVFVWHFTHGTHGYPVPYEQTPFWGPLVLFDEGHVGVALFMTLSGYLFSKLLDGKDVIYSYFLWNRLLRLFPLLIVVLLVNAASPAIATLAASESLRQMYWQFLEATTYSDSIERLYELPMGVVFPTWPNGGWSITAELHFYLALPLLLALERRSAFWLAWLLVASVLLRTIWWWSNGTVQDLAYWTIAGRIDQFVLGVLAFHFRNRLRDRTLLVSAVGALFITFYHWFDASGGFYHLEGYPSRSLVWTVLPTIEGVSFATAIAWYDMSFRHSYSFVSRAFSRAGEYSYSIYLLHFFFVFRMADWVNQRLFDISSFYIAFPIAVIGFIAMIPIGYVSMRLIEAPFLAMRRPYCRASPPSAAAFRASDSKYKV